MNKEAPSVSEQNPEVAQRLNEILNESKELIEGRLHLAETANWNGISGPEMTRVKENLQIIIACAFALTGVGVANINEAFQNLADGDLGRGIQAAVGGAVAAPALITMLQAIEKYLRLIKKGSGLTLLNLNEKS